MRIYLIRHSKTTWNQERRLQGHLDSPLTKEGIENAKALSSYFRSQNIDFDYVFSSPILRAYQTAQYLTQHSIIKDERLMEMNFGIFEGVSIKELLKREDHLYENLWHHPELFTRIPQGESYEEVMERASSFLESLNQYDKNSSILVVTHGMFFIVLLAVMLGIKKKDLDKINQNVVEGCSLNVIIKNDQTYQLEIYNQCDFLPYVSHASFSK